MRKTRYPTSLDDFGLRLSITERNDRIAKDGEHLTLEDVAFAVRALQERLTTLALPVAYGGTGLTSVGAAGTVLQSDGAELYFGELPESQGGGITSLNALTDATQTFAKTNDTNVTLTITSAAAAHTFALGWTGQLAVSRGGTGASSLTGYVYGNGASAFTASATIPASAITAATFASAGPSQYRFQDEVRIDGLLGVGRDATTYAIEVNGSLAFYGTNLITGAGGGTVTWQGQPIASAYLGSHTHAASDIASGTLTVAQGGTGRTTGYWIGGDLPYVSSDNVLARLASPIATKFLKHDTFFPAWSDVTWSDVTSKPTTFTPAAHQLDSATYHTVSGLTTGQVLRATGATGFAFGTLDLDNASAVTGTLGTANGGTNLSAFTANGLMYASSTSVLATSSNLSTDGSKLTKYNSLTTTGYGLAPFLYQAAAGADAAVSATTMLAVAGFYRVNGSLGVAEQGTNATYTLNVIFTASDQSATTITKAICSVSTADLGLAAGQTSGVFVFYHAQNDNLQYSLTKSGGNASDGVTYSVTLEKLRDNL